MTTVAEAIYAQRSLEQLLEVAAHLRFLLVSAPLGTDRRVEHLASAERINAAVQAALTDMECEVTRLRRRESTRAYQGRTRARARS